MAWMIPPMPFTAASRAAACRRPPGLIVAREGGSALPRSAARWLAPGAAGAGGAAGRVQLRAGHGGVVVLVCRPADDEDAAVGQQGGGVQRSAASLGRGRGPDTAAKVQ